MADLLSSKLDLLAEKINEDSDLLPCHTLELVYKKGGCDDRVEGTLESLTSGLFPQDRSKVVGILGTGCSLSTIEAVTLANRPEIQLVVLHNGGSLTLENYKNSVSILGSSRSLIDLSLALIEKNDWHNVDVLYESSHPYYLEMKDEFLVKLAHKGVSATIVAPVYTFFYPFDEIRSSRVRIVFLLASVEHSRRILCLAYHMRLVYPACQWIILSNTLSDVVVQKFTNSSKNSFTFRYSNMKYVCTKNNLMLAVEKTFLVSFKFNTQSRMFFNMSYAELLWESSVQNLVYSFYDALYAWALVLHKLMMTYPDIEFDYGNTSLVEMTVNQFFDLTFEGVSGQISFNSSTGLANRPANLYQISNGREITIGTVNSTGINVLPSSTFSHIPDHIRNVAMAHDSIMGFFFAVQFLELSVVIMLHILTFVYRKTKSVKATSPKLIHLAFIGSYVFITTLMLRSIIWANDFGPKIYASLCQIVWAWGLPLSFTLTLGIVTVRIWRLYRIFVHYLDPGKFISNPALTVAVLLLTSIDIVVAIIWTTVDPMGFRYREIMVKIGSQYEVRLEPQCLFNPVWLVLVFLFKIALLVALIILTVLTRKIPNATFTTNSIRIFAYSFSTIFVLGFGIYYFLVFIQYPDRNAEFITLSSLLNVLFILFVTFIIAPPLAPVLLRKVKKRILPIQ